MIAPRTFKLSYVLAFQIPLMPPSVNSLYNIFRHGPKLEVKLKPEVLLFKTRAKSYVPPWLCVHNGERLYFEAVIHDPEYLFKNGEVRKKDLGNMEKALLDAICDKIGVDDRYVKERVLSHVPAERGYVECKVGVIEP